MNFTVAIDGPAASGKGTIGRAVSKHFGFKYLDTGKLYRMAAVQTLKGTPPLEAAMSINLFEDVEGLRSDLVATEAGRIAAMPEVRSALLEAQRRFSKNDGGTVLDGRDIGTVVCPDAQAKLFITASANTRASRRFDELLSRGCDTNFEQVLADLKARDEQDQNRSVAPLRPAIDAQIVDTTDLSINSAISFAIEIIAKKLTP